MKINNGPPTDQSDCCICYNYILILIMGVNHLELERLGAGLV